MINHPVCSTPPITHVAVADMDATYSAYVVAEHHTVNNTDNSDNDANGKHNHANYNSNNYVVGQCFFCGCVYFSTVSYLQNWQALN